MDLVNRVKQILVSPQTEWPTIEAENDPHVKVLTSYVVPLALIPAVASFIGYGLIGHSILGIHIGGIGFGVRNAIVQYITMLGSIYVSAFVIDALANSFGAKKDFNRSFSLVAYSYTPMFVAGIFYILPLLSFLASLAGLYGLYLLYTGLQPMTKVSSEKQVAYFIVSLIVMLFAVVIVGAILGAILLRGAFGL